MIQETATGHDSSEQPAHRVNVRHRAPMNRSRRKKCKTSVALCEGTLGVLDDLAAKAECSRSEYVRRLIVTAGIEGVMSPAVDRFLNLTEANQSTILQEIREKLNSSKVAR